MNSSEYQVTIKSANQKVDDYVTKCNPVWTVHRLKQHISETHINKPKIEDQRLIYAGNLLKDSHTLKQIFFRDSLCTELTNSSKTDFTIHLVCHISSPSQRSTNSPISSASSAATSSRSANSPAASSSVPATSNVSIQNDNRARPSVGASRPNQPPPPPVNRSTPMTILQQVNQTRNEQPTALNRAQQAEMVQNFMQSDQMRQQMAVFQQLAYVVAAQIVNNLNNVNSEAPTEGSESASQIPNLLPIINGQAFNVSAESPNGFNITTSATQLLYTGDRQPAQFVPANVPDGRGAEVPQNENINNENNANVPDAAEPGGAQFGFGAQIQAPAPVVEQPAPQPVEQEVPIMQHDVIDWVYYSIRAAVLMAALYIHASMFRLLFIVGLLSIAYFFNRRRIIPTRQEPQPRAQADVNAVAGQQQQVVGQEDGELRRRNGNANANRDEQGNADAEGANGNGTPVQERVQEEAAPNRVPFLKLCYLVVTDFLASLVPE